MGPARSGTVHWLDHFAFSPACGTETGTGERTPRWLSDSALLFEQQDELAVELQNLAVKIADHAVCQPLLFERCAQGLELPSLCDPAACLGSAIVYAFRRGMLGNDGEVSRELTYFAFTGRAFSDALPAAFNDLVNV